MKHLKQFESYTEDELDDAWKSIQERCLSII